MVGGFPLPFPRTADYRPREGSVVAVDIDGDGRVEIIVSLPSGILTVLILAHAFGTLNFMALLAMAPAIQAALALSRTEFVEMLATRFGLSRRATASKTTLLLELEALLAARRERGESSVLVIDEAQSLPLELLEEIRLLANIETAREKLVSVILAGQPELADRLNERSLRQLKQRVALRCELRPLTLLESCAYIAGRIRAAGGVGAQTFTREAVILMHERAKGIPRTLSVIADNALLAGFAVQRRPVSTQLVLEVCHDLDLRSGGDAGAAAQSPAAAAPDITAPPSANQVAEHMSPNRLITFDSAVTAADAAGVPRPGPLANRAGAWKRRFSFFRATV